MRFRASSAEPASRMGQRKAPFSSPAERGSAAKILARKPKKREPAKASLSAEVIFLCEKERPPERYNAIGFLLFKQPNSGPKVQFKKN